MIKINYPWRYFHKHPILTLLVVYNYRQRMLGRLPDEWYWADARLLKLAESK